MPTTTTTDPVIAAYEALIRALSEAALASEDGFDRATNFRAAVISQRDRWTAGHPAVRVSKKAAA